MTAPIPTRITLGQALFWGAVLGVIGAFARHTDGVSLAPGPIAEVVGEVAGPVIFAAVVWLIFARPRSTDGAEVEAFPQTSIPAKQTKPPRNLTAVARLGQVVYWGAAGAAALVAAIATATIFTADSALFPVLTIFCCGLLFLAGWAVRYVLAGY